MPPPINIVKGNLRDFCYIASNLRQSDAQEIFCQLPEGSGAADVAVASLSCTEYAYTATYRGQPAAAFGFTPFSLCGTVFTAWLWGTNNAPRTIPHVGRFGWRVVAPELMDLGVRRIEIRSLKGHDLASKWLKRIHAKKECDLPFFGRNDETFELFSWTIEEAKNVLRENTESS